MASKRRKKSKSKPKDMSINDALAVAIGYHQKGQLDPAQEIYERILSVAPTHPDALHFLGVLSHQRGQYETAVANIQRAIDAQPEYVDAYNNLGNILLEQGRLEESEQAYRKVIALKPDSPLGFNNLGIVLKEQNKFDESVAAYQQAIGLEPDFADAYFNLGNALKKQGNDEEALTSYRKAIILKPQHTEAYKKLGRELYAAGRSADAVEVYRQWLKQDPGNPIAQHMLVACSGEDVPERASDDFVQQSFDKFAGSFDEVLKRLEYRAPLLVSEAVEQALGRPKGALDILDAGCGTGLCGPYLRPYAQRLVGVDLSPAMVAKASGRGGYDDLITAELTAFLIDQPTAYDLIVSADTLCYFGELDKVFVAAAGALRSGGRLVFTVEHISVEDESAGFSINPHGRYSHTDAYVQDMLVAAGLSVDSITVETLRNEMKKPVAGLVVIAQKVTTVV
jgi:predicted TPR repeat methyltransferase